MYRIIIVILLCTYGNCVYSQHKEGYNWITGTTDCRVSFDNTDTSANTFKVINYNTFFDYGTSCISDSNGKFLFSCDGFRIWDTMGNIMDNGDSLCPDKIMNQDFVSLYTQGSLILPFSDGVYYVFTPTVTDTTYDLYWHNTSGIAPFDLLLYHKIDMNQNGGAGKVIKKAIPLLTNKFMSKSQMQACRHGNGTDWWLLKQALDSNIIYRFLVTKDSIYGPFVQNFMPLRFGVIDNFGQACFNKMGTKYAAVQTDVSPSLGVGGLHDNSQLFMANFDRCTGELSNPVFYNIPNLTSYNATVDSFYGGLGDIGASGVSFSDNGNYLYISKFYNILQLELNEPDSSLAWYHLVGLDTSYVAFQRYQGLMLAPDHKIYVGNFGGQSKQMSVINKPDMKGSAAEFCPRCLRFPLTGISAPPNMPDYNLGPLTPCWPLDTSDIGNNSELLIYPNPTSNSLFIQSDLFKTGVNQFCIYDMLGQKVIDEIKTNSNGLIELDIKSLNASVYFLRVGRFVKKFVKE